MSTPTRADEPFDESVRNLLWRLRARLVSPPAEQRVQADLERLLDAAAGQAHAAPSAGADPRPDLNPAAGGVLPDHPVVPGLEVTDLADVRRRAEARRLSVLQTFGRVAAASVVVVAVATGIASARDGSVTLQALFGREGVPVESAEPEPVDPAAGLAAPAPDADPDPAAGGTAPDASGERTAPEATAAPEVVDEPADAVEDDAPAATDDAPQEPVTDDVVAAPPPDDVAGFGGPQPCEEDDLAACLPDDEPAEGTDGDGGPAAREPAEAGEDLAKRRFGGGEPATDDDADADAEAGTGDDEGTAAETDADATTDAGGTAEPEATDAG